MTITTKLCLLVICLENVSVWGWGTRFEPVNRGFARSMELLAHENHNRLEESVTIETYRMQLQDMFDRAHEDTRDVLELVRERADELATETFAEFDLRDACEGEECEMECAIPEDWVASPGAMDASEVMSFLGIRRAEPLRKRTD